MEVLKTIIDKLFTKDKIAVWLISGIVAAAAAGGLVDQQKVNGEYCKDQIKQALDAEKEVKK